jgi:hypothetical protein
MLLDLTHFLGILRVPGNNDEVEYYKKLFDEGKDVEFKCNCHDAVALLKQYIRDLPSIVIPPHIDTEMHAIVGMITIQVDT